MVAELKIALRSSFHDRINSLTDSLPVPWLDASSCFGNAYDPMSHGHSQVLYRLEGLWNIEFVGHTPTGTLRHDCVRACMCGVLPLPLPLHLHACLCHRAAVLPSVLAENQVLNALWLGSQLIPCSPASVSLSVATLCLNEPKWNYMETSTELYGSSSHPGTKQSLSFIIAQTFAFDLLPFSFIRNIFSPQSPEKKSNLDMNARWWLMGLKLLLNN